MKSSLAILECSGLCGNTRVVRGLCGLVVGMHPHAGAWEREFLNLTRLAFLFASMSSVFCNAEPTIAPSSEFPAITLELKKAITDDELEMCHLYIESSRNLSIQQLCNRAIPFMGVKAPDWNRLNDDEALRFIEEIAATYDLSHVKEPIKELAIRKNLRDSLIRNYRHNTHQYSISHIDINNDGIVETVVEQNGDISKFCSENKRGFGPSTYYLVTSESNQALEIKKLHSGYLTVYKGMSFFDSWHVVNSQNKATLAIKRFGIGDLSYSSWRTVCFINFEFK